MARRPSFTKTCYNLLSYHIECCINYAETETTGSLPRPQPRAGELLPPRSRRCLDEADSGPITHRVKQNCRKTSAGGGLSPMLLHPRNNLLSLLCLLESFHIEAFFQIQEAPGSFLAPPRSLLPLAPVHGCWRQDLLKSSEVGCEGGQDGTWPAGAEPGRMDTSAKVQHCAEGTGVHPSPLAVLFLSFGAIIMPQFLPRLLFCWEMGGNMSSSLLNGKN